MYTCCNSNLLYHGCIPMTKNGAFEEMVVEGVGYRGKALMDFIDKRVQNAYFLPEGDPEKEKCRDFMWYLWCGAKSPVYGKDKMTTLSLIHISVASMRAFFVIFFPCTTAKRLSSSL